MAGGVMTSARTLYIMLLSLVAALALASLATGPNGFDSIILASALTTHDPAAAIIIGELRLPRALAALLVGFALGVSGAALQGLTRNPLAEPGVLGVSACATLGATLMLYFGIAASSPLGVAGGAIVGALAATAILAAFAHRLTGVATLILIGVGLSSFAGALMALLLNFAPNPFSLSDLVNWSLGSVANRSLVDLAYSAPPVMAGTCLILLARPALTLLAIGDLAATAHGLDYRRTRLLVIGGTGLAIGGAVALAGAVGFVGIVAPHLVRPWVRHDPGRTIWPAGLAGAAMLLAADMLIRLLPTGTELRLGVVAALAGAPLFMLIAWRRGGQSRG
jgi:iron complex transport system permease protein